MKDKPSIKGNDAGGYTVTRPRVGYAGPETQHFDTHAEAAAWLAGVTVTKGSLSASTDRTYQPRDGIATVPAWEPLPYGRPSRR